MEVVVLAIAYNHKEGDDVIDGWKTASAERPAVHLILQVMETHEQVRDFSRSSELDIFQINPSAGLLELDLEVAFRRSS